MPDKRPIEWQDKLEWLIKRVSEVLVVTDTLPRAVARLVDARYLRVFVLGVWQCFSCLCARLNLSFLQF